MKLQIGLVLLVAISTSVNSQNQIGQTILGDEQADFFGYAVAINATGNTIIASSPFAPNLGERRGEAKVYVNNNNNWELVFEVKGEEDYDELGAGVAMSDDGNVIAVGLDKLDVAGQFGEIKVYGKSGNTYIQKGNTIVSDESLSAFGQKIVLSDDGNILVSGAYKSDANGGASGQVKVFQFNIVANSWDQLGNSINGNPGDYSGYSVAFNDDGTDKRIVVGCPLAENETGQTKIFQLNGNNWEQVGQNISGFIQYSQSGVSVAIGASGNRIAVGEPASQYFEPTVRIFDYNTNSNQWEQLGNTLEGEEVGDSFGNAINLSDDGLLLSVGAYNANGQIGRVYLYKFNLAIQLWELFGIPLEGQSNEWGEFGKSVAMSDDSSIIIASEPRYNNSNGYDFGAVMIYNTIPILGIEGEILDSSNISIYPNPILTKVKLDFKNIIPETIEIYNIEGKLLNNIQYSEVENNQLDFTAYKSGIYIIKVKTDKGIWAERVVKK